MTKIKDYGNDENISDNDVLIGTDKDDASKTKNYSIGELKTYLGVQRYKEYSVILTQTGTNAPVVDTLFLNELGGDIVWERTSAGIYTGTLAGAFTIGKTKVTPMNMYSKINGKGFYAYAMDEDTIGILCRNDSDAFTDLNMSQATDLTIKVYN